MGPGRSVFAISAYLRAEQQLGRVSTSAVPETVAELMLAVSFNRAMQDHFFFGAAEGDTKARRKLREAVRALMVGLQPANDVERAAAKGSRR
jgi:hypothetical protein